MARPNLPLIDALRITAQRLAEGADYRWTHMGSCNCGHLAQTVTRLDRASLHRMALEKAGDWSEQARDYCPNSGYPLDHVIRSLLDLGLSTNDLADLERLQNDSVRRRLPPGERELDHRAPQDTVRYLRAWADLLEDQLEADLAPRAVDVRVFAAS